MIWSTKNALHWSLYTKENVYFGKIYNTTIYEGESIGNQPDLLLTM